MDNAAEPDERAPDGWLEILAESEADLSAGHIVPGDEIMRELHENIARLEARRDSVQRQGAARRPS